MKAVIIFLISTLYVFQIKQYYGIPHSRAPRRCYGWYGLGLCVSVKRSSSLPSPYYPLFRYAHSDTAADVKILKPFSLVLVVFTVCVSFFFHSFGGRRMCECVFIRNVNCRWSCQSTRKNEFICSRCETVNWMSVNQNGRRDKESAREEKWMSEIDRARETGRHTHARVQMRRALTTSTSLSFVGKLVLITHKYNIFIHILWIVVSIK